MEIFCLTLKEKNLSYGDFLIICGDAGICWSPQEFQYFLNLYNDIGCTIIFVDGNHENFEMLNNMPLVEYKGALMHQIDKHIFHVLRGEIMTLGGKTFLCVGGAVSIDKMYRTPYVSWCPEEEITYHDIDNDFYKDVKKVLEEARKRIYSNIQSEMVLAYWQIGKMIVEKQAVQAVRNMVII